MDSLASGEVDDIVPELFAGQESILEIVIDRVLRLG
jgi:hypothetical protein